jgi:succinoglycan biosynthesis protein ExoA
MSNASPLVSIILPCRNEQDQIATCLGSILTQEPVPGGFEVIVADGMSDDGTREILQQFAKREKRLRVVDNPARIVSAGLNLALKVASGEIIVRMDAHTRYASDYVRQCVEVLRETNADNVGGPWVAEGKGLMGRAIATAFQSPFAVGGARGHNPAYEGMVDTVYLGCWPRHVFDRIGLFDEELVRNQDDEFNLRLARTGGKIWQSPRIRSRYNTRSSTFALFRQYMQYGYWKVKVIQKHKLPGSVRHLIPAGLILSLIILTPTYFFLPFAANAWWLIVGTYSVCVLLASLFTARAREWKLFPFLILVFPCFHFGYGYGFLRGVINVILRRDFNISFTQLTRTSAGRIS